jgi:hypothetical protein
LPYINLDKAVEIGLLEKLKADEIKEKILK